MDNIQLLLVIVVISLTVLLVVVGLQVMLVISDVRKALRRVNSLLDDSILGGGLLRPDKLGSLLEILRKGKKSDNHSSGDHFTKV